jgi:3-deoxy-D-arabino-heptulosonate 7-phosphate (DAHP) synthase
MFNKLGGAGMNKKINTIHLYIAGLMDLKSTLKELSKHQPNNQMCLLNQSITDKYLVYDGTEEL